MAKEKATVPVGIRWWWPWSAAAGLLLVRLALLPLNTDLSGGFSHDSAYIAIVARNLISGKGWVNDASWLVFLQPTHLPMPYHNANPLYPLLTALAAKGFGLTVVTAGMLVSALASVILLLAAFYLVSYWLESGWTALIIAAAVALFPPLWETSLHMLPDALDLALLFAGAAFFVRAERGQWWIPAGILFGAAWLSRSTAALAVPAMAVYAFATWKRRTAVVRLALVGVTSALVASPWLIHTAKVWGSPFRSDAPYYAFQDFYSRSYGGSLARFLRSTTPPPSPGQLLRTDFTAVVSHVIRGIPNELRVWIRAGWEDVYLPRIVFLALLCAMAVMWRRHFRGPALAASTVYCVLLVAFMGLRFSTMEGRYLAPFTAVAALWVVCGLAALLARRDIPAWGRNAAALACIFFGVYIPIQDARLTRQLSAPSADTNRRLVRRSISASITGRDPTIVEDPYFYTYDTRAQALSIPESNDAYLKQYMDQYHCRWIIFTDDEIAFWKPAWRKQLPGWLRVRAVVGGNTVFERVLGE